MGLLSIRHKTIYRYREPVRLGPHRLMLRPRESRDVRLLSSTLETVPPASLSWANDVFGNAVVTVGQTYLVRGGDPDCVRLPAIQRPRTLRVAGPIRPSEAS